MGGEGSAREGYAGRGAQICTKCAAEAHFFDGHEIIRDETITADRPEGDQPELQGRKCKPCKVAAWYLGMSKLKGTTTADVALGVQYSPTAGFDPSGAPGGTEACLDICGDGKVYIRNTPAYCDDGNDVAGEIDGCSPKGNGKIAGCQVQEGWECSGGDWDKPDTCRNVERFKVKSAVRDES